ncbi:MAG: hypothetical protein MSE70_05875, partial [Streptococcus sp.]|nr:hypothetical protein [Streptococcus sp.]
RTAPHRTSPHSTAQHSTAQHSTAQHSTAHYVFSSVFCQPLKKALFFNEKTFLLFKNQEVGVK